MSDASAETRSLLVADPARPAALRLLAFWDQGAAAVLMPDEGDVVVGRGDGCGLRVISDSVSRRHARVVAGSPVHIEDLGSANGTRVAGHALQPGKPVPWFAGQTIEIGAAMLVLQGPVQVVAARASETAMAELHKLADLVAAGDIPVIIQGETGVGKEVLAERLHARSQRARGPFIKINCAALPESMAESELFGHEKGAFTGALAAKPGLIEAASGGTLLLDEVAELPLALQAKLLRAAGNGEVLRVGALTPRRVDVRFLAATHQPLDHAVARGAFRADLYHRLDGITLTVPPLRERPSEILPLARSWAAPGGAPAVFSRAAEAWLLAQAWPGNVRELKATIERALLLAQGAVIEPAHLAAPARPSTAAVPPASPALAATLREDLQRLERDRILQALERCGGNQTKAAKALGMSRRALLHRLDAYDVPRPRRGG